jgi:hypothetical protein
LLFGLLAGVAAQAQDLEPRAYSNAPVGLNFLIAGYGYADGNVSTDPALPIEDAELEQHTALLAGSRSFALLGRLSKIDLILPYSWISGSALVSGQLLERDTSGLGDPRLRFTWLLWGAPALTLEEWQRRFEDLVAGFSLQVVAPTGTASAARCGSRSTRPTTAAAGPASAASATTISSGARASGSRSPCR